MYYDTERSVPITIFRVTLEFVLSFLQMDSCVVSFKHKGRNRGSFPSPLPQASTPAADESQHSAKDAAPWRLLSPSIIFPRDRERWRQRSAQQESVGVKGKQEA